MTLEERVGLLANALVSEMARAYFTGDGEASSQAIAEMSIKNTEEHFKNFCTERFQSNLAGKNVFGIVGTTYKFINEIKAMTPAMLSMVNWAAALAGDKIEKASIEDLERYSLANIKYSAAVQTIAEDLLLEKGL